MKHYLLFVALALGLLGCADVSNDKTWSEFSEFQEFNFHYPPEAAHRIERPSGSIVLGTKSSSAANDVAGDYYIAIYYDLPIQCDNIGVTNPEVSSEQGIPVIRGKVDFPSDYELTELQPDCRVYKPYTASYILCSEKDNVQVAICISQVTDDPALANSILDTFQWTPRSPL